MATKSQERRERRKTDARKWAEEQGKGFEATSVQLPEGIKFFKPKAGLMKIDVIPYIAGKGNPHADEGYEHFERTFWTHGGLGLQGKSRYNCLAQTFKKRCPECDFLNSPEGKALPKELIERMNSQCRQLWIFVDTENRKAGFQIFDSAYFRSFGQLLKTKIEALPRYKDFSELKSKDGGKTLQLSIEDSSFGAGARYAKITNIEMIDREEDYDESIFDKVPCLDNLLIDPGYEKLKKIIHQEPDVDEDSEVEREEVNHQDNGINDEKSEKEDKEETKSFKEGDMVKDEEDNVFKVLKVGKDGSQLLLEDKDGEKMKAPASAVTYYKDDIDIPTDKEVDPDFEEDEEEEEEEGDFDDDDDFDEEENKALEKKTLAKKGKK